MKRRIISDIIAGMLILLFVYTALTKLFNFQDFKHQMFNQELPESLKVVLILTLPGLELITAGLLYFQRTRLAGLSASFVLMILFTGYVGLVLLNVFDRVPCSCGGVLKILTWKTHFIFNILFLLLTLSGLYISYRERRLNEQF